LATATASWFKGQGQVPRLPAHLFHIPPETPEMPHCISITQTHDYTRTPAPALLESLHHHTESSVKPETSQGKGIPLYPAADFLVSHHLLTSEQYIAVGEAQSHKAL